ncbi:Uncharacterized protein SCF082_LOCUS30318 [Durusdinium trenchii]|uniref:Uncharacterized protein n=1 Tax=Durusdinium trenchii TaxID=1381693 RepID=A0ABP0N1R0_9DINO
MSGDTSSDSPDELSAYSDRQLWKRLPRKFRAELGEAGGTQPRDEVLAFLTDTRSELGQLMERFSGPVDSAAHRALPVQGLQDTVSWLRKQSGAKRRCDLRVSHRATTRSDQSRAAREAAELLRWRSELADLIAEAKLPLAMQACNCREPDKIISSAPGGMRASTIKARVREWRKLRAYSLGVAGIAWPPNLGIVPDYLQERVAEPCARTVPHSILAAFSFMEKAGGVAVRDRVSGEQVLRNFVDQSTMDLEGGVPPNERNFIGRWNITTSADEYLRTSQQVLVTLQEKVVASLGGEDRWGLRESGIDELIQSIVEKGGSVELAAQQRKVLWLDPKFAGGLGLEPTFPDPAEAAVAPPEECQDTDECCSPSPFFVTIVGSQRLRRLHRRNGCGVSMVDVQCSEDVWTLRGLLYDLACKHCWRAGENITVSEAEEGDDSEQLQMIDRHMFMGPKGFDALISFAGLDETSAGVRAALKQFGLDVETSLAIRKEVALLVGVWESAKTQRAMQVKQKLDANASGQARLIQTTEYAAMRSAVEAMQGSLRDKEAPSKSLVASKLEQLAHQLRRICGKRKHYTTPPGNPEELRLRHRRLGLAWAFVKSRHANRAWINASIVDDFRKLSDHVLGSTVAGLRTSVGVGPSWSLVLTYELELRKSAYRYVRDNVCADIGTALAKACEAPALYGVHFDLGPATPSPVVGSSQAQSGDNFGSMDEEAARDEAEYEEGGAGIHLQGVRGQGPPLFCNFNGKRKTFTDGFGLCSPGRWSPEMRQDNCDNPNLNFHYLLGRRLLRHLQHCLDVRKIGFLLASGKVTSCPFTDDLLQSGREIIFAELRKANCKAPIEEQAEGQPFYLCALEAILDLAGDPDAAAYHSGTNSFAEGVRLGVDCTLPCVPALFTAKQHWRCYEHIQEEAGVRENYITAKERRDVVQKQFESEAELGAMEETNSAQAEKNLGKITIASLGALEKSDGSFRCRCFAECLDHQGASWVFAAGESYRSIASLELLATLAAVLLFEPGGGDGVAGCFSAGTDNKGNSHAVSRCMTTKFPLCVFNMELAVQLQKRGAELHLHWLPRLQNVEADQLTNGDFSGFADSKRLRFKLNEFRGEVLAEALEFGIDLYEEVKSAKARKDRNHPAKKARKGECLPDTDPW